MPSRRRIEANAAEADPADAAEADPAEAPAADAVADFAPNPEDLEAAEALRAATGRLVRSIVARGTASAAGSSLPSGQAAVLGYLSRDGRMTVTDLAEREQVRHQSMARTVKLLADQSLVELSPDKVDRRRVMVRISDLGQTRLDAARHARSATIAAAIATLPPDQQQMLRELPAVFDALSAKLR